MTDLAQPTRGEGVIRMDIIVEDLTIVTGRTASNGDGPTGDSGENKDG